MRKRLLLISIAPLLLSLLGMGVMRVAAVDYPAIYVYPTSIMDLALTTDENFTVSIMTDYTGDDINSYQFTLSYDPQILEGIHVGNGDLISADKDPTATFLPGNFNNTEGKLGLTGALFFFIFPPPFVTSGPGTLANVTFKVIGTGDSAITIGSDTKLIGWDSGQGSEYNIVDAFTMPTHIQHGYFDNTHATPTTHVFVAYDLEVSIHSNSSISAFQFNGSTKQLSFNVTGPSDTNGFCDISIPDDLLWGDFSVYKNASLLTEDVDYTQTYNGTHYIFNLAYIHSTHVIKIEGTEAIPEFPSYLILALFAIATLLAAMIGKRRLKQ
ncbi:MAG: hypothetical protein JSV57_03975 [Candidatus Bathyarchaeota archaeon]|nr:MAG: hypothetical protein JSV57_03975 [Candidatus Bathyarchaeota archaeon]